MFSWRLRLLHISLHVSQTFVLCLLRNYCLVLSLIFLESFIFLVFNWLLQLKTYAYIHICMDTWFLTKNKSKTHTGKKKREREITLSTNGVQTEWLHVSKWRHPFLASCLKLNSKWIKDVYIRLETLHLEEQKVQDGLKLTDKERFPEYDNSCTVIKNNN